MPRVFLYNIPEGEKLVKIRIAALRSGLTCVSVPPEDFSRPIGTLAGEKGSAPASTDEKPFSDEMLLMEEMDGAFLDSLRAMGVLIPLKAVLTGQNRQWSSNALHRELSREHEAFRKLKPEKKTHRKKH